MNSLAIENEVMGHSFLTHASWWLKGHPVLLHVTIGLLSLRQVSFMS